MSKMLRLSDVYGPGHPIGFGRTKFFEDFVYREGGPEFVPNTTVPRLRLKYLNSQAAVVFEDEVMALVEALRAALPMTQPQPPNKDAAPNGHTRLRKTKRHAQKRKKHGAAVVEADAA